MIDYQRLDTAKNEIRLLYFERGSSDPTSSTNTANTQPREIVQLELRTASLDAYTKKSLDFMVSRSSTKYIFSNYIFLDFLSRTVLSSTAERTDLLQAHKTSSNDLFL